MSSIIRLNENLCSGILAIAISKRSEDDSLITFFEEAGIHIRARILNMITSSAGVKFNITYLGIYVDNSECETDYILHHTTGNRWIQSIENAEYVYNKIIEEIQEMINKRISESYVPLREKISELVVYIKNVIEN